MDANRGAARREIEQMMAAGDVARARDALAALELSEEDPLRLGLEAEMALRDGRLDDARGLVARWLDRDPSGLEGLERLAIELARESPEPAFACLDALVNAGWASGDRDGAVRRLERFTVQWPLHVPGLLRLVELYVDLGRADRAFLVQIRLADAYLAAGLAAEARILAEDLVAREPGDPGHQARLRQALTLAGDRGRRENVPGGPRGPQRSPAAAGVDEGGAQERAEPDPFDEFRVEIARDSSDEAASQYFRLALTYREMGMIEEAMTALELAAASAQHRFEAAALLGSLNRKRNRAREAVTWMERAADAPAPTKEDARRLLYDLADTLEELGEKRRALTIFDQLERESGGYRDVRGRIARLAAGE